MGRFLSGLFAPLSEYFHDENIHPLFAIFNCLLACFGVLTLVVWLFKGTGLKSWHRNLIKNCQRLRERQFEKLQQDLEQADAAQKEKWQRILRLDFQNLRDALQKELFSAAEVLEAYFDKALRIQHQFNPITEFILNAREVAKNLDDSYRNKPKPPLFGLLFSVKDNIAVSGCDVTLGCAKNLNCASEHTSSFVEHLQSLGAVAFCRTNVPSTLLSFCCSNCIYGTTQNPHRIGSCLTAAGGNAFGVGSDLAGSTRIPAHCAGVVNLKPTSGRLTVNRAESALQGRLGQGRLGLSYGFFTRNCSSQRTLFEAFLTEGYFAKVSSTVPIQFDSKKRGVLTDSLRIGYFLDDGFFQPTPACQRAVREVVEALEKQGHCLIPISVPSPKLAIKLVQKCLFPDNGRLFFEAISNEDVHPDIRRTVMALKLPFFVRRLGSFLLEKFCPQLSVMAGSYVRDLADLRHTFADVDHYRHTFTQLWQEHGLDAVVCPGFPLPAVPHEYPSQLGSVILSTGLFNLLDFPAGSLPVTTVTENDDEALKGYYSEPESAGNPMYKMVKTAAANSVGLPIGVQVVTLPYQEEKCLEIMQMIEKSVEYSAIH